LENVDEKFQTVRTGTYFLTKTPCNKEMQGIFVIVMQLTLAKMIK